MDSGKKEMNDKKTIQGYKGFRPDMTCNRFQFAVGEISSHKGKIKLCEKGFHFCEHPLDVFQYYDPANSRFAQVEGMGAIEKSDNDTKVVCSKLHVKAEITIKAMIESAVKFVFDRAKWTNEKTATNAWEGATESNNRGAASATGYSGAASATGDRGAASATGDSGAASATGYRGAASATGYSGAASATGYSGAASATGYRGAASATGDRGAASATGDRGAASATGDRGAASATGYSGAASATGKHGVASSLGIKGKARGAIGVWLVLSEWEKDEKEEFGWKRTLVRTALVDGKKIKADTFYVLEKGEFIEAVE